MSVCVALSINIEVDFEAFSLLNRQRETIGIKIKTFSFACCKTSMLNGGSEITFKLFTKSMLRKNTFIALTLALEKLLRR